MIGKALAFIIGIIVLVAVAGSLGSKTAPSSSAPTTAPIGAVQAPAAGPAKSWAAIKDWTGSGIKDTEKFTVGNEWRIDWDFAPAQFGGIIQVFVYSDANDLVGVAANTQNGGADTSFQHKSGTYYLKINSANGNWKVGIQDMR